MIQIIIEIITTITIFICYVLMCTSGKQMCRANSKKPRILREEPPKRRSLHIKHLRTPSKSRSREKIKSKETTKSKDSASIEKSISTKKPKPKEKEKKTEKKKKEKTKSTQSKRKMEETDNVEIKMIIRKTETEEPKTDLESHDDDIQPTPVVKSLYAQDVIKGKQLSPTKKEAQMPSTRMQKSTAQGSFSKEIWRGPKSEPQKSLSPTGALKKTDSFRMYM